MLELIKLELLELVSDSEWLKQVEFSDESLFLFQLGSTGRTGNWFFTQKEAMENQFVHYVKHPSQIMIFASVRYGYRPIIFEVNGSINVSNYKKCLMKLWDLMEQREPGYMQSDFIWQQAEIGKESTVSKLFHFSCC